jgi:hypothetical protein
MKYLASFLLLAILLIATRSAAEASPYTDLDFTIEISDHRWGVWRMTDTTSHDVHVLNQTSWISGGVGEEKYSFRSYWVFALGPLFAVYVSQGALIFIGTVAVMAVLAFYIRQRTNRRRQSREAGASRDA